MDPEFITYQKFNDPALAEELAGQLELHNVPYSIEEESLTFSITFIPNDPLQKEYAVKIKNEDFEKVNKLLKQIEEKNTTEIDRNYYLFSFTDNELFDVLAKEDEWSAFDVVLARRLLAERGKDVSEASLLALNKSRIEELKRPDVSQLTWIIVGYLIAVSGFIVPSFVSAIGVFVGWHLSSYKKTLPDGERVYGYNKTDRMHGKVIFYLGIIIYGLSLAYIFLIKSRY